MLIYTFVIELNVKVGQVFGTFHAQGMTLEGEDVPLLDLSMDVWSLICSKIHGADIAALCSTCRSLRDTFSSGSAEVLWEDVYARSYLHGNEASWTGLGPRERFYRRSNLDSYIRRAVADLCSPLERHSKLLMVLANGDDALDVLRRDCQAPGLRNLGLRHWSVVALRALVTERCKVRALQRALPQCATSRPADRCTQHRTGEPIVFSSWLMITRICRCLPRTSQLLRIAGADAGPDVPARVARPSRARCNPCRRGLPTGAGSREAGHDLPRRLGCRAEEQVRAAPQDRRANDPSPGISPSSCPCGLAPLGRLEERGLEPSSKGALEASCDLLFESTATLSGDYPVDDAGAGAGSAFPSIPRGSGSIGLRGNELNYHDPSNSLINRVLETRRGIPITLSLVHAAVCRRAGIPVHPVGLPMHFMNR